LRCVDLPKYVERDGRGWWNRGWRHEQKVAERDPENQERIERGTHQLEEGQDNWEHSEGLCPDVCLQSHHVREECSGLQESDDDIVMYAVQYVLYVPGIRETAPDNPANKKQIQACYSSVLLFNCSGKCLIVPALVPC